MILRALTLGVPEERFGKSAVREHTKETLVRRNLPRGCRDAERQTGCVDWV